MCAFVAARDLMYAKYIFFTKILDTVTYIPYTYTEQLPATKAKVFVITAV